MRVPWSFPSPPFPFLTGLLLGALLFVPARESRADGWPPSVRRRIEEGDRYFRRGYYLRAAEAYHLAILDAPDDGTIKLRHGHAQFAIGNFSYAAYEFRRGLRFAGYPADLDVDLVAFFPTPGAFQRALAEAERNVEYYPDDPVALTVLGYARYFGGEVERAEPVFRHLLEVKEGDPFARYFLQRIERERRAARPPLPVEEEEGEAPPETVSADDREAARAAPEGTEEREEPEPLRLPGGRGAGPVERPSEPPVRGVSAD